MDADGNDVRDGKDGLPEPFRSALLLFIWRGFNTDAMRGKTYGNVFGGSGWGSGEWNWNFGKKRAKIEVLAEMILGAEFYNRLRFSGFRRNAKWFRVSLECKNKRGHKLRRVGRGMIVMEWKIRKGNGEDKKPVKPQRAGRARRPRHGPLGSGRTRLMFVKWLANQAAGIFSCIRFPMLILSSTENPSAA
jgi:hypothetical protein